MGIEAVYEVTTPGALTVPTHQTLLSRGNPFDICVFTPDSYSRSKASSFHLIF